MAVFLELQPQGGNGMTAQMLKGGMGHIGVLDQRLE
jgi:hypothetical protein